MCLQRMFTNCFSLRAKPENVFRSSLSLEQSSAGEAMRRSWSKSSGLELTKDTFTFSKLNKKLFFQWTDQSFYFSGSSTAMVTRVWAVARWRESLRTFFTWSLRVGERTRVQKRWEKHSISFRRTSPSALLRYFLFGLFSTFSPWTTCEFTDGRGSDVGDGRGLWWQHHWGGAGLSFFFYQELKIFWRSLYC